MVHKLWITTTKHSKSKKELPDDGAVKFSESKAAKWSMAKANITSRRDVPQYQLFSVVGSVSVFLIYFLYLRQPNDLDEELNVSLFEHVPGLEQQLKIKSLEKTKKN